nr:ferredoxin [Sphingomonas sp. Y57]
MRVHVDCSRCMASGACMAHAPDVFDQAEDGTVVVLLPEPPEHLHAQVEEAAAACPANVITIE